MFAAKIKADFSAAHQLQEGGGKCESLHGHNFAVEVVVESEALDPCGMVIDFRLLKTKTRSILEALDHHYLNELPMFQGKNPSAENIAAYIFAELSKDIDQGSRRVSQVSVWEAETSQATYFRPAND
jgi:6-pyruvoyltetrahydropterin/6-carboxytetrahydropterin synthase